MNEMLSDQINREIIESKGTVIYGTGLLAERLYKKLYLKGISSKIKCFTQTLEPVFSDFCGLSVYGIEKVVLDAELRGCFFLIAVGSDEFYQEISVKLNEYNISDYADGRKLLFDSLDCIDEENT